MAWILITFTLLLLAIVWLSYRIMTTLAQLHTGRYSLFRLILFPGVVLHELGHLLACWITNTPVVEINFWTTTGGHVVHHKPRWPIVQPIISFAPFGIGIVIIALLTQSLGGAWWFVALKLYILLVTSATLAPSKSDFLPAIEGALFIVFIGGILVWLMPQVLNGTTPFIRTLNNHLTIVTIVMIGFWLILQSLHRLKNR